MVTTLRYTADELEMRSFKHFETQFAHLGFNHFQAIAPLRPWVQRYFHLRVAADLLEPIDQTFYPDGGTSLHFYLPSPGIGDVPSVYFYSGQQRHCHSFALGTEQITVRFQPGGAFHLLGVEFAAMQADTTASVIDVTQWPIVGLTTLLYQLVDTPKPSQRIALVERWLLQRAQQLDLSLSTRMSLVPATLPQLIQTQANLETFYGQLPMSRRQFERKFKQETGLSPAQLLQLNRVKIARNLLSQSPSLSLAQVAFDCGFYDQAHLHQHFLRVMQQTPGQYKKRKMSQISNITAD
ncbi:helix-turn-helix domain-containing protein [Shewanella mangrovisoli]|uniref:helix-turn-helix domain-containing protein n=1 Tax=Shewanella mangrovisoli TaxID=2864211 RepID=UPI0035B7F7E1